MTRCRTSSATPSLFDVVNGAIAIIPSLDNLDLDVGRTVRLPLPALVQAIRLMKQLLALPLRRRFAGFPFFIEAPASGVTYVVPGGCDASLDGAAMAATLADVASLSNRVPDTFFPVRLGLLSCRITADELSPYLLQHAGNPVDWHPWDAEALGNRVPPGADLSVDRYSACHWCHVMATKASRIRRSPGC